MKIIVKEEEGYMYLGGVANEDKAKEKAERKMKIKEAASKSQEVAEGQEESVKESSGEEEEEDIGKWAKIDIMYNTLFDMTKMMKRQDKWQKQVDSQLKLHHIELLRIAKALEDLKRTKKPQPNAKPTSSI